MLIKLTDNQYDIISSVAVIIIVGTFVGFFFIYVI